jgi:hypothetical protein
LEKNQENNLLLKSQQKSNKKNTKQNYDNNLEKFQTKESFLVHADYFGFKKKTKNG